MLTEEMKNLLETSPKGEIWVCLDGSMKYNCLDLKSFNKIIRESTEAVHIITPLTYAINNDFALRGYKLYVVSHFNGEKQQVCVNDLLLGRKKDYEKDLRPAHNIERLILNNVYDIRTDWENENYEK